MSRIHIIEDDRDVVDLVRYNLRLDGLEVTASREGIRGLLEVRKDPPDLLILDWMLPGISGIEVCRELRRDPQLSKLPIVFLSARGEENDRLEGLAAGADDYVPKPFSPRELCARVKALLRRKRQGADGEDVVVRLGELVIDPNTFIVTRSGTRLSLTVLEFRLLHYLATHPSRLFTRQQLLDAIWGTNRFVVSRVVDVYIWRLRERVEPDPSAPVYLRTVRGLGYLLEAPRT